MRAMWRGSVGFGLVSIPVRLYAATENHDVRFHQVHRADNGRIRYKRTCEECGKEIDYADIAKATEGPDGELTVLEQEDFDQLPTASGHEIDVIEFVPAEQVDPMLFSRSYYVEPEKNAVKPYVLLREALRDTDRLAIVRITLRQRESLAALRVHDDVIVVQTMLWHDEVRDADFGVLDQDVSVRAKEKQMAASLVENLSADFDPEQFDDTYEEAVRELVASKAGEAKPKRKPRRRTAAADNVTDLSDVLQRSIERSKPSGGKRTQRGQQAGQRGRRTRSA